MDGGADTIAAVATAPGRGGVAVVRVSGPAAFAVAARVTGRSVDAALAGRFVRARFRDGAGATVDDGLLLVFAAPRSYTGEDAVELQGHGGAVAPRRVLDACLAAGARLARRGEFTQRAFLNGRLDLSAAEAVIDLIDARTARAADAAHARLDGRAASALETLYAAAADLSARTEHALDVDESDLPPSFAAGLARDAARLRDALAARLAAVREGRLLRDGARVVLAGAPNAGKSSLLNALLGADRALVSPAAGTTRDTIEEWTDIGGWPVLLIDTAGLRDADDAVEAVGIARARATLAAADIILALDCDLADNPPDDHAPSDGDASARHAPLVIRLHAKCDLGPGDGLNVSARTGEGLDALRALLAARLADLAARPDETSGADAATHQTERLRAADAALARALPVLSAAAPDLVLAAEGFRAAADALGALLGKSWSADLLDAVFSRFCVGK